MLEYTLQYMSLHFTRLTNVNDFKVRTFCNLVDIFDTLDRYVSKTLLSKLIERKSDSTNILV